MSLYEKYGRYKTLQSLVRDFYADVLESPRLAPYFVDVEMETLIKHQVSFLSQALGGPISYTGRELDLAHRHLSVTAAAFQEVAVILEDNLRDAGVEDDDVATIMGKVASFQPQVVDETA